VIVTVALLTLSLFLTCRRDLDDVARLVLGAVQSAMPRPFPNVDAVEEFSIQTSSFDAQYGRGVGGVVNVVTKSGTNLYHGTAFEFLRNFKLNARNFFSGRDALKRNQFGGGFGGPIRKDRTFFFLSYQGTRISSATPAVIRTAPSAAMRAGNFSEWLGRAGRALFTIR